MRKGRATRKKAANSARRKATARTGWRAGTRESPVSNAEVVQLLDERESRRESSPLLTGGDVDADWQRAGSTGEEAVGGSSPTPDQDVVDEIGRALGVEQDTSAEVVTSGEILRARDRDYWRLEREAADGDEP
jgi:uncharacterized protein DUF6335